MLSQVKWNYMIPLIRDMQHTHETSSQQLVQSLYSKYDAAGEGEGEHVPFSEVENAIVKNAESAVEKSLALFHQMLFKYADGFVNTWVGEGDSKRFSSSGTGYPGWWLQSVDYPLGPPPV
jgi:hypothetical protein